MSEVPSNSTPPDPEKIQQLASMICEMAMQTNPTMPELFSALAEAVVAFSLQYVHAGTGEITCKEVAKQLARFSSFTSELAEFKLAALNVAEKGKINVAMV